jgi:hydroxyacylglutathione hydrolase
LIFTTPANNLYSDVQIKTIVTGFFFGNCYLVWDDSRNCVVIDPGDEEELIFHTIQELALTPHLIVGTHANLDAIGAAADLRESLGVHCALHEAEIPMFEFLPNLARYLGLPVIKVPPVDRWLQDGDRIEVGGIVLEVIHTPGHTPGSICLNAGRGIFTGDTLLSGSYGRTDLKGGSEEAILTSIHKRLFQLDDATEVYPGHGPSSTIGEEKRSNWAVTRKGRIP